MKRLIFLLGLAVALVGGWYLASPWLAMKGLADAARDRDAAALEGKIDLRRVRESVREQLLDRVALSTGANRGLIDGLRRGLGVDTVEDIALEAILSPGGMAALVATGSLADAALGPDWRPREIEWDVDREGLNRFRAIGTFDTGGETPALLFERRGIGWTMVGIELFDR